MQNIKEFFNEILAIFKTEKIFNNDEFSEKFQETQQFLPEPLRKLIKRIELESTAENVNFEKITNNFQKNLKNANLSKNISIIYELESHSMEFSNKLIQEKIIELSKFLPYYRQIRGDGNCFYRAIGIGYIEQLFFQLWSEQTHHKSEIYLTELLYDVLEGNIRLIECNLAGNYTKKSYRIIENILKNQKILYYVFLREISWLIMMTVKENDFANVLKYIENSFINNHLFDISVIVIIRSLIHATLKRNIDRPEYMPFFTDPKEYLMKLTIFGEEAENILIPITSDAFHKKIIVNMVHMDRITEKPTLLTDKYEPLLLESYKDEKELQEINLYFRPGHYDLGYEKNNVLIKYFHK